MVVVVRLGVVDLDHTILMSLLQSSRASKKKLPNEEPVATSRAINFSERQAKPSSVSTVSSVDLSNASANVILPTTELSVIPTSGFQHCAVIATIALPTTEVESVLEQ